VKKPIRIESGNNADFRVWLYYGDGQIFFLNKCEPRFEKDVEFDNAAFGMVGLETSLSLSLVLVKENILTFPQLIEKMTINPSRILNIDKGALSRGADADITIIDPETEVVVDKNLFRSRSKNSPFHGHRLTGRAAYTIVSGRVVFSH